MKRINPARIAAWLEQWFPERQVYIRAQGQVQFYRLTPVPQMALFLLASIFLGWASFATVNVVFKDRIIAAADHRYQQMQVAYEEKLAQEGSAFDDLNASLATAEAHARALLAAHQHHLAGYTTQVPASPARIFVAATAPKQAGWAPGLIARLVGPWRQHAPVLRARPPLLRLLDQDIDELQRLDRRADDTIRGEQTRLLRGIRDLRTIIARTGLPPDQFMRRSLAQEGVGGPEIPLSQVQTGIADRVFSLHLLQAEALLNQLSDMGRLLGHMPLAVPVNMALAHRTSPFGPRLDPFSGRYSFHPGLDFSAPLGTAITATAPGIVVFAGNDGTYGNMVEIDHGYGLKTRYAHLSRIGAALGAQLAKGAVVGWLGSTGRSTGPHLHYEVRYDGAVRDPAHFLDALAGGHGARLWPGGRD